ncbi:MAG TPA: ATPase [Saprospirales bacterium]|nr:ATPase [Saprospirales bacterium]
MPVIEVHQVSKSYGAIKALDNLSFQVGKGEIFGLIGPDGAGKTTLFRILATLVLPDHGQVRLLDMDGIKDYKKIRQLLGYMPGKFSLYQDLTVEENLEFFASVFGTSIRKNYDLIAPIYSQIEPFKTRRAGALSGGMKQKLALCCALIHRPEVLLLDEPGTGVDPVSRQEFWEMLAGLRKYGITILVSTPNMDEAELCDRIALMQEGRIMATNTPEGIIAEFNHPLFAVRSKNMYSLIQALREMEGIQDCYAFGEFAHVKMESTIHDKTTQTQIMEFLQANGHEQIEIKEATPTIEDCFISFLKS